MASVRKCEDEKQDEGGILHMTKQEWYVREVNVMNPYGLYAMCKLASICNKYVNVGAEVLP